MALGEEILMSMSNYWTNRPGESYRRQQQQRTTNDNLAYITQQDWLKQFFAELTANHKGKGLRILDYGCGFGRVAAIVDEFGSIEYFGFDISLPMTEEFRAAPPSGLASTIDERVRIADDLDRAFSRNEKFDIILSISVLIHNPEERARAIIASMFAHLAPGGRVVLIENPHTAVSTFENFWHGGCWCHSYVRYFNGLADVEVIDKFADRHAIYIASRCVDPGHSKFFYHEGLGLPGQVLAIDAVLMRGLDRAVINSASISATVLELSVDTPVLRGQINDLNETLLVRIKEVEQLTHRLSLKEREVLELHDKFAERQCMLEDLGRATSEAKARFRRSDRPTEDNALERGGHDLLEWNASSDVKFSHDVDKFAKVLHIFHQEWFGIRAAAGSLPGEKLAVAAEEELLPPIVRSIYDKIANAQFQRIVFHGMSRNAAMLINLLARRGLSERLYIVIHGAVAQWTHPAERHMAYVALEYLANKQIRKLHFMKSGFDWPVHGLHKPILFNLSPRLAPNDPALAAIPFRRENTAVAPGWVGLRKNVYTNVVGAALSSNIKEILAYATDLELPSPLSSKLRLQRYEGREATFSLMAISTICLNASLVDCHPMVNIEAQVLGCPCLRGPLFLDALESHEYVKLTTVVNVTSVTEVRDKVNQIIKVPLREREEMTQDYQKLSDILAINRYQEFLEL